MKDRYDFITLKRLRKVAKHIGTYDPWSVSRKTKVLP